MVGYGDIYFLEMTTLLMRVLDWEVIVDFELPSLDCAFVGNSMVTLEAQLVMPFLMGLGSLSSIK